MNIQEYCLASNFYFDDEMFFNFHCSLQTKPFTILYGPSGTGKSKIAELYADFICHENGLNKDEQLCFVPVKSNWTSASDLLGFYDYLNNNFVPSKLFTFLAEANKPANSNKPFFLILDEMNLSVVEHYFSDFLACLESRRFEYDASHDLAGWETKVASSTYKTLSQAIILAYLTMVNEGALSLTDQFDLADIRSHQIILDWKTRNFNGKAESWTPMFRTEFNQKDANQKPSRLAGKFFEAVSNGVYKFREQQEYSLTELSGDIVLSFTAANRRIIQHEIEVYRTAAGPVTIPIPLNLYIIGSINMDESTNSLSSKVLDRANVIEMNSISRDIVNAHAAQGGNLRVNTINTNFSQIQNLPTLESIKLLQKNNRDLVTLIYDINDGLLPHRANMGHRAIFEIAEYVNFFNMHINSSEAKDALDFQLCQKLIPKLMGADERVESSILHTVNILSNNTILTEEQLLSADLTNVDFSRTLEKLKRMLRYYSQNGFVNFANV